jgi:hypothetical protein
MSRERRRWDASREARGTARMKKLNASAKKGERGNVSFPDPAIDEYRRVRTVRHVPPYIHRFPVKTDEYKFIFISFGTDEYNLNIFVDEFKNLDK